MTNGVPLLPLHFSGHLGHLDHFLLFAQLCHSSRYSCLKFSERCCLQHDHFITHPFDSIAFAKQVA